MQDQAQKRDAGKFDPLMIEEDLARALEVCNAVLEFGKEKYGKRGGWMQVDIGRYKSAGARHRREVMKHGIAERDTETNLLHKAHEIVNGLFELEMFLRHYSDMSNGVVADYTTYNKPIPPLMVVQPRPILVGEWAPATGPNQTDPQPPYYSKHGRDGSNSLD